MLVLSRSEGESFVIGDDIEITLISCRYGKARIGIKAPRNVAVNRREVADKILRAKVAESIAAKATKENHS